MILSDQESSIIDTITHLIPKPKNMIDIGCGAGNIILHLDNQYNINVTGIDMHEESVKQLEEKNIQAYKNDARNLEFSDNSFDWSLIANVLHHIPNPADAIREALRVANYGVIISELWFDLSLKCQQLSAEVDQWCKRLHQTLGFFHRDYLSAGEIIALLKGQPVEQISITYNLHMKKTNIDYWMRAQQEYLNQLAKNHVMLWQMKNLMKKMQNQILCEPGYLIVTVKKHTN
jgi:ubiquinone/menaquinone biosynthesis C-methylase UbiE